MASQVATKRSTLKPQWAMRSRWASISSSGAGRPTNETSLGCEPIDAGVLALAPKLMPRSSV
jgi:hypothetical protein